MMIHLSDPKQLRDRVDYFKKQGKTIGLVPTMGALHKGHAALVKESKKQNDITVVSIFVNPTQFNNQSDFEKYPKTIASDKNLLESIGCDILYQPEPSHIYDSEPLVQIVFPTLYHTMEGLFRPGHFEGVALIVAKLFNMVAPHHAYFGQKDLQQCVVIKHLVQDLSFPLEVKIIPTVRENSGLALSSRNLRLDPIALLDATHIYKSLKLAQNQLLNQSTVDSVKKNVEEYIRNNSKLKLEYFSVVDSESLQNIVKISSRQTSLCMAAYSGEVRLIDNIFLYE